jgi:hypothetical protein
MIFLRSLNTPSKQYWYEVDLTHSLTSQSESIAVSWTYNTLVSKIVQLTMNGKADIDRIEGGNEPGDFTALFDDFQLTDEDTEGILKKVQMETHEHKLWRVHREGDETFFAEVALSKDSLKSDDVFLLDAWDDIFVWRGKDASSREKFDGNILARRYDAERVGVQEIELIEEGQEPEEFFKSFP